MSLWDVFNCYKETFFSHKHENCSFQAAAKLKQTEGVVVLTVCSPNMKDPEDSAAGTPTTPGKNF